MFIVLSNLPEGKHMPDTQNIETTPTAPEQEHEADVRASHNGSSHTSRRAAAIEAAYILEAVRK
jgi:hypothetical protein